MLKRIINVVNIAFWTTVPTWQLRPPQVPAVQILTRNIDQTGQNKFCASTNKTVSYTCSLGASWKLQGYQRGMVIVFLPDVDCNTAIGDSCSLNIDNAGTVAINGGAKAGIAMFLFYNGTNFDLML